MGYVASEMFARMRRGQLCCRNERMGLGMLSFEGCTNEVLVKLDVVLATGSRKPSDYILLFLPPVTAFWSFRKLAQGTSHAGEENPVEEISLIWLLPKWRSFMKMAVVAEVSTAEDMCVEPQCHWTNLFLCTSSCVFWIKNGAVLAGSGTCCGLWLLL